MVDIWESLVVSPAARQYSARNRWCHGLYPILAGCFPDYRGHDLQNRTLSEQAVLIYVFKGQGWFRRADDSENQAVGPGEALLIPGWETHSYGASEHDPWSIYWVHVMGSDLPALFRTTSGWEVSLPPDCIDSWRLIMRYLREDWAHGNMRAAAGLVRALMLMATSSNRPESPDGFEAVEVLIRDNLHFHVTLDDLAHAACLSRHHFSRRFKACYGMAPMAYFQMQKMRAAATCLDSHPDWTIQKVADHFGYDDPFYFSRLFKTVTGYSPTAFRALPKG